MSNATQYINFIAYEEPNDFGDTYDVISVTDAITACQIQELQTLKSVQNDESFSIIDRILELEKQLKYIKLK